MSLRWRILLFSAGAILLILAALSFFGITATRTSTNQVLAERLVFAEQVAHNLDFNLGLTSNLLIEAESEFNQAELLQKVQRFSSITLKYIYLVNRQGQAVGLTYPGGPDFSSTIGKELSAAFQYSTVSITASFYDSFLNTHVVYLVTPLTSTPTNASGFVVCAAVDLNSTTILNLIDINGVGKTGYIEIVDSNGVVLSSSKSLNLLTESDHGGVFAALIRNQKTAVSTCHNCHEDRPLTNPDREIITFAPLSNAPWGVVVRQPEEEALANTRTLQIEFSAVGLICLVVILPLVWFATKSLTNPINQLTLASQKISRGSLEEPIVVSGTSEIGILSRSFDDMRLKLKDSRERVEQRNRELESLIVENRRLYEEVRDKEKVLAELLKHSISAQEDERKRIARELHDETSQALTTLSIGLATIAKFPPVNAEILQTALKKNQELAIQILDEIHRLILDLRPSVLDDLGLVPALEWYAKNRLEPLGIKVNLETSDSEERLPPHIEIALFRIAQEAISNIALHARAEYASISLDIESKMVILSVEDDGIGFQSDELLSSAEGVRGLGIRGMMERAEMLGGTITIFSRPGEGTRIHTEIPVTWQVNEGK